MSKKYIKILILFFLSLSCNRLPTALGSNNDLTIICSDVDWKYSQHIIKHFFDNKFINTPQKEYVFNIVRPRIEDLQSSKMAKNILILSLSHPLDSTVDVLSEKILKKHELDSHIASLTNLFANGQKAILIESLDAIDLEKKFQSNIDWIVSEYSDNMYREYFNYIKDHKNNKYIQEQINKEFNISMFIQEDYKIIKQGKNFLWIGRGYPYRWLIFKKLKGHSYASPYELFKKMDLEEDLGIGVTDYYMKETSLNLENNNIKVYRGVYNHRESDSGGPFALYMLDNIGSDEVILIASIINNPGNSKMNQILQIDALVKNINF